MVVAMVNPITPFSNAMLSFPITKFTKLSSKVIVKLLKINIGKEIILKFGVKNTVNVKIEMDVISFIINPLNLLIYIEFLKKLIISI